MGKHRFRILDTNVLINHLRGLPESQKQTKRVKSWALALIETYATNLIASPVRIEFLCGARTRHETELYQAYLQPFEVIDDCQIPRQDWLQAERIAKHIKDSGRARKLGDCLLIAISDRLHCDIVTGDTDFVRRVPPQR